MWFCLQFLLHLQKGKYEREPHQTKKINIVFGPDYSKGTSGLSCCEYTLSEVCKVPVVINHLQDCERMINDI